MTSVKPNPLAYFYQDECKLDDFIAQVSKSLKVSDLRHASDVQKNIPIYDMRVLHSMLDDHEFRRQLMIEWAHVLGKSSGVLVLKGAYNDTTYIDAATEIYNDVIAEEKQRNGGGADHFAAAGNNDRIWNSLQKLCEKSPEVFAGYFANPAIDAVCEAWLGPNYQMTAQVNLVRPGGAAQLAHRDYHLGFQTSDVSAQYPAHVHDLSPVLTLQGGIAHSDMPIDSGPTKLLPFSQLYRPGYAAWRRPEFRAYFEENFVQQPLSTGDALFFSPALFHGAGANVSADAHRMVNLLQISSPFGRAMETIDRKRMCKLLYPHIRQINGNGKLSDAELHAIIAATAEGYSFPTNLDLDPPKDGLAPETQHALFSRALSEGWTPEKFDAALDAQARRQHP